MNKDLVKLIIEELYGEKFSYICGLIMKNNELDLRTLLKESKQSFNDLKEVLIILIKNGIINYRMIYEENNNEIKNDDIPENAIYFVNFSEILHNMRLK